ncbi:hypothetical protein N5C55_19835 [Pseudomonas otitidis]|uniref:Lipoprotein n=2 Tax=Metapseudomonas otitidis TaxID=319939 RepID=A0ABU3XZP7_9GAMM|nr:hypothetical protein [Pseudomonas otitidis]MDH1108621.1 hypothetical protein [Pseudomonas otitidis]MDH1160426.1 hypothetical protein [Pseudomonas otitidis]MDH1167675.1 hypothetical protein [Pseudomonas otitidis]MDV3443388.1 hypothetical protein [Pseudomonas otitidis]MEE1892848.1 hypothetical protein [Pseudomonas otitidis]
MEKETQHDERTPPPPHRAVALALAVMALGLGGCSTHPPEKKQGQILAEALTDQLAIASGDGANATQLAALLSQVARLSTPRALVIGGAPALDAAVMQGALKGQRLEGLQVIFAGLPEQEADITTLVRLPARVLISFRGSKRQDGAGMRLPAPG